MKVETTFNVDVLDFETVLDKVANDVINEIKSLVSQGKNTSNESLMPKKDGSIPTFKGDSDIMGSLTYKITKEGFIIYIDNEVLTSIMCYINDTKNWTIFTPSDYLDEFITQKLDEYLQEQFDNL